MTMDAEILDRILGRWIQIALGARHLHLLSGRPVVSRKKSPLGRAVHLWLQPSGSESRRTP